MNINKLVILFKNDGDQVGDKDGNADGEKINKHKDGKKDTNGSIRCSNAEKEASGLKDTDAAELQDDEIWLSPGFHKSCDMVVERYTRVNAFGAPTFSLDYSPFDEPIKTKEEPKARDKVKRSLNLAKVLRSPYFNRKVEISAILQKEERLVTNLILAGLSKSR